MLGSTGEPGPKLSISAMILIRLTKIATIAALAAYAFIVAYDNIVDYGSNYEFVKHVLSIDTTLATR
jgi:predicted small integral membrane protein